MPVAIHEFEISPAPAAPAAPAAPGAAPAPAPPPPEPDLEQLARARCLDTAAREMQLRSYTH